MRTDRSFIKGVVIGAVFVIFMFFLLGAVDDQVSNTLPSDTEAFRDVACSSDGQIVYVIDVATVFRSSDGGQSWKAVLKKQVDAGRY